MNIENFERECLAADVVDAYKASGLTFFSFALEYEIVCLPTGKIVRKRLPEEKPKNNA